jgi:hypothetical protein
LRTSGQIGSTALQVVLVAGTIALLFENVLRTARKTRL